MLSTTSFNAPNTFIDSVIQPHRLPDLLLISTLVEQMPSFRKRLLSKDYKKQSNCLIQSQLSSGPVLASCVSHTAG